MLKNNILLYIIYSYIMMFKEALKIAIKNKRPSLREVSINNYINNIVKLATEFGQDDFNNIKFLDTVEDVKIKLNDKSNNTKKTYYATIAVVLDALDKPITLIKEYRKQMFELQEEYNKQRQSQMKTDKQLENWLSWKDLNKEMVTLRKQVDKLDLTATLNTKQRNLIQQLVVVSLYLLEPDNNPPTRNDYTPMIVINHDDYIKIDNDIKKTNNYLVIKSRNNKYFAFNDYKTSKQDLQLEIPVGSKLNSLLNKWLKINTSGYLILNNRKEPMSSNGLTKYLNTIFKDTGKKISTSLIRHAYLSNRYNADHEDKQKIADMMMHSTLQQVEYTKND